jgi:lysozyme family protein
MTFDDAFTRLIGNEGRYANDPKDPGGETYTGISRVNNPTWAGWTLVDGHKSDPTFPACLTADATLQAAVRSYYLLNYWGPAGCDAVPDLLKFELFDAAVNTSAPGTCGTAIKMLQHAARETEDGILGPLTLQALQSIEPWRLLFRFDAARLVYYSEIHDDARWLHFGRGWVRRVASNMALA